MRSSTKRTKLADEFERLLGADNLPSVWTIHAQDMRVIIAALRERQFGPDSGYCPHCGMDPFRRCVPPRDHTQCAFFKQRQSATERSEP